MRNVIIYIFFFSNYLLSGQGFKTRYNVVQASDNSTKALFESSPGNYIGAGFAIDTSSGLYINRIAIMGLNSLGQVQWTKKYGNSKLEYLNNGFIQRCFYKQGNYLYYTGCALDSNNKYIGVFLKFDMNGDTLWQKIYRDTSSLEDVIPQMVTGSVDNGFLITGFFQNNGTNPYNRCMLIKTDVNGNELWRKKIGKIAPDVQDGKAIIQDTATKKIAIVGYQYIGNYSNYDHLLILDSLGVKINQTNLCYYGGSALDLIQTSDKKFVVVGLQLYSQTIGGSNCERAFAAKFDINNPLNPIWKIDGFGKLGLYNGFTCITELDNTDLLIGGFADTVQSVWNGQSTLPNNTLTRLTIVDKNTGHIKWNRYYDYKTNDPAIYNGQTIHSINTCQDGSWLAAIEGVNYGVNPMFFVKYDSTGCDSSLEYCTTLLNLVGLKEVKAAGTKFKVFPNPFKDMITVETDYPEDVDLILTDVSGREVKRIKISQKESVPLINLSSGMYLLSISRNKEVIYKEKLIKE